MSKSSLNFILEIDLEPTMTGLEPKISQIFTSFDIF